MGRVFSVIGPPGCGKTDYVSRQARRAVAKYGSKEVLICSLTRAAAREAAGRDTGVHPSMMGTLHSHVYRALECPKLCYPRLSEWNEQHIWKIRKGRSVSAQGDIDVDPLATGTGPGDELLMEVDRYRAFMMPKDEWPIRVRAFEQAWAKWKEDAGVLDFTDLIEQGLRELPVAPGAPTVILVDEAQDLSVLELKLLRQWGASANSLALVGDPDQTLYAWRGADPEALAADGEPIVLSKSFRVPRAVHKRAIRWVKPVEYYPRDYEGRVGFGGRYESFGNTFLDRIEKWSQEGETTMILASCAYMLKPITDVLEGRGIPYHNPYSRRWNPLGGESAAQKILAYLEPRRTGEVWSVASLKSWVPVLQAEPNLHEGAEEFLKGLKKNVPRSQEERLAILDELFTPRGAAWAKKVDAEVLIPHLMPRQQIQARYPRAILRWKGVEALAETPKVIVGTIHSVKGGQADNVIVFPDLSAQGWTTHQTPGWNGSESIRRLFYVAYTRARKRVILGDRSGEHGIALIH